MIQTDTHKSLYLYDASSGQTLGQWVLPRQQTLRENRTIHNFNGFRRADRNVLVGGDYRRIPVRLRTGSERCSAVLDRDRGGGAASIAAGEPAAPLRRLGTAWKANPHDERIEHRVVQLRVLLLLALVVLGCGGADAPAPRPELKLEGLQRTGRTFSGLAPAGSVILRGRVDPPDTRVTVTGGGEAEATVDGRAVRLVLSGLRVGTNRFVLQVGDEATYELLLELEPL